MTDEMFDAMAKAYKMGCDEAREICSNYKIRIEKLEAALQDIASGKYSGMVLTSMPPQDPAVLRAKQAMEGKDD